jgi:hypothetical protein
MKDLEEAGRLIRAAQHWAVDDARTSTLLPQPHRVATVLAYYG